MSTVMVNDRETPATPGTCSQIGVELDPAEWWVVSNDSALARRILACYPDFEPVLDNRGELVDIVDLKMAERFERRQREKAEDVRRVRALRDDARRRGYFGDKQKTPVNAETLPYLHGILSERIAAGSTERRGRKKSKEVEKWHYPTGIKRT